MSDLHAAKYIYDPERIEEEDAAHIAANDPSATIALCEALLRILDRHTPKPCGCGNAGCGEPPDCGQCWLAWPCPDIRDIAAGEGIEV